MNLLPGMYFKENDGRFNRVVVVVGMDGPNHVEIYNKRSKRYTRARVDRFFPHKKGEGYSQILPTELEKLEEKPGRPNARRRKGKK
jgi:hypothetical protein